MADLKVLLLVLMCNHPSEGGDPTCVVRQAAPFPTQEACDAGAKAVLRKLGDGLKERKFNVELRGYRCADPDADR